MGGKKKTKWRKLPLEEFTKDIPTKREKFPPEEAGQSDLTKEENSSNSYYNETAEIIPNLAEPYEYIDGIWYPTSCVVYNPAEVGLYSNYVLPIDNCYYYYTVPEMSQMQEYVPVPYQDYASTLMKDTVYLLLPTQTLRPSQALPNVIPEWQTRRRRRRCEGYADYAAIPEKSISAKVEEKERNKKPVQYVNSRRNSYQSNNFRRMTTFSDGNSFDDPTPETRNQLYSKTNETKTSSDMNNEKNPTSVNKRMDNITSESTLKSSNKSLEMCGIHMKNATEKNELQTEIEGKRTFIPKNELPSMSYANAVDRKSVEKCSSDQLINDSCSLSNNTVYNSSEIRLVSENKKIDQLKEQLDKTDNRIMCTKEESLGPISPLHDLNREIHPSKSSSITSSPKENFVQHISHDSFATCRQKTDGISETNSQSSLPDILNTVNKASPKNKMRDVDDLSRSSLPEVIDVEKGKNPKSKALLTQTSYLPNLLSSEALHHEMEMELKQLKNLHSLQANQAIYKLAYDENVTDQSEADSRSPSPVDPESQVPTSLTNAEILIHEADSGSDAGSEDVELLPHRYESETFLNENKHVYVNKLSLAVELLRTQESLPYDEEFKRVVGENNGPNNIVPIHTSGKINLGFEDDPCSPNTFNISKRYENISASVSSNSNEIVTQSQLKHSANSSSDSAIFSDVGFDNLDDESCETAKEVGPQGNEIQDNTEEIRAGYRRFGVQARHYFSPRTAFSLNPCFCCIIM